MTNLSHTFTVDAISKTTDVDVCLNVLVRRESITYGSFLSTQAVNVGYISSSEISAANNISISDRSTDSQYVNNTVIDADYTVITGASTFTISTSNFLLTDVFTDALNTVTEVPLFYKHILDDEKVPRDTDGSLATGYTLQEIEILDQYMSVKKVQEKKIDYTDGIIYLNLLPEYSSSTDYTLYYLRYKVRTPTGEVIAYTDLLDLQKTYNLADFDDLDNALNLINDGRKVYLIEETAGTFTITLPAAGTYAYQPSSDKRFEILYPTTGENDEGWFVRITNNIIYTSINSTLYKYSIGEFLNQLFTPYYPYKFSDRETPALLTSSLLKVDNTNIVQDDAALLYVSVFITDADDNGLAAYTTDDSLVDTIAHNGATYKKWSRTGEEGIKSIDHYTGIIEIAGEELLSTYTVEVSYYYLEENYKYSLINFNPLFNQSVITGLTAIFLDPDTIYTQKEQTIYYLHTDDTGKVIESNHADFNNDTELWNGNTLYYESLPSFLTTDPADSALPNYIDPSTIDYFISSYTTVEAGGGNLFLLLGEVTVDPNMSIDEVTTYDSRKRGGGIIESEYSDALSSEPEAAWVWDEGYWDGIPYPGNASYMVEVPVEVLTNAGGTLTQQEVRQIVERHTAAGVYPITKAYGVDILIDEVVPTASGIMLTWESNGYQI